MRWVWEHKNWPNFEYDATALLENEKIFYTNTGIIRGIFSHLANNNLEHLKIDILTQEAVSTSSIEGEILHSDIFIECLFRSPNNSLVIQLATILGLVFFAANSKYKATDSSETITSASY